MKARSIRSLNTYGLVASEILLFLLAIFLWMRKGFSFDELTTTLAIVAPILASHVALVLRFVVSKRTEITPDEQIFSAEFGVLSCVPWICLVSLIALFMILKAYNLAFESFEEFKTLIAVAEALLGGMVGKFVKALYS